MLYDVSIKLHLQYCSIFQLTKLRRFYDKIAIVFENYKTNIFVKLRH